MKARVKGKTTLSSYQTVVVAAQGMGQMYKVMWQSAGHGPRGERGRLCDWKCGGG